MSERTKSREGSQAHPTNGSAPPFFFNIDQQPFQSWARGMSALTEEMGQFMQARLREDIGAWSKLTACRDPSQLLETQRQYVEKSAADYLDEAGKLTRLALDMTNDSFSALRESGKGMTRPSEATGA